MGRVDLITGTLGKALGGASGGYTSGRKEIIDLLRQRSRPYLFSNSLHPDRGRFAESFGIALRVHHAARQVGNEHPLFPRRLDESRLQYPAGTHPIVPIMLGDAALATKVADAMLKKGVYVIGFSYPVVPKGKARIRTQISAAHSPEDLEFALERFGEVKAELGL